MFEIVKPIGTAEEIRNMVPVPEALAHQKAERDKELIRLIKGEDKRLLVIVGPCSADSEDAVCDYVARLRTVQDKVNDKLLIIPRIYTNKPRTKGEGYKGMLHQPDPDKPTDIYEGILAMRRMHVRAMRESGMGAADEMLYPDNYEYVSDLLSYISVGARSSENQQHRLVASGIDLPVGVKNPMNGSGRVLLNGIYAAQIPNEFKYHTNQVRTAGNPLAHAILRGAVDNNGVNIPNYHYEDVIEFSHMYEETGLSNPAIIIDTNHSNSGKDPFQQVRIVKEVLNNRRISPDFGKYIKGFLIESYLVDGAQGVSGGEYGKSITDACLGWGKTERLIMDMAGLV